MAGRPRHRRARWAPLAGIVLAAGLGTVLLRGPVTPAALAAQRERLLGFAAAHPLAAVLAFVAAYVIVVALSLPGATLCSLAGGMLFGVMPGLVYNVMGATLGAVLVFLAARMGFGPQAPGGAVGRLRDAVKASEVEALLVMRLIPVVPFFAANLAAAGLGVPLGRFVWTTALGILPAALVLTWAGAGLGEVIAAGRVPDAGILLRPGVLGPLLGLAVLVALVAVVRRRR